MLSRCLEFSNIRVSINFLSSLFRSLFMPKEKLKIERRKIHISSLKTEKNTNIFPLGYGSILTRLFPNSNRRKLPIIRGISCSSSFLPWCLRPTTVSCVISVSVLQVPYLPSRTYDASSLRMSQVYNKVESNFQMSVGARRFESHIRCNRCLIYFFKISSYY